MRLLVVEDERYLATQLAKGFTEEGYVVDVVHHASGALTAVTGARYDAILLDVLLPDGDGFEVCRRLRKADAKVPLLMLTARDTVSDRINGLDAGADDYVGKPFSFAELCARVRALIRRGGLAADGEHACELTAGKVRMDPISRRVWLDSDEVYLSAREFVLLELLLRNAGQVLTRSRMLDHAWGFGYSVTSNIVDQYVKYLRQKLGYPGLIETVRGVGYRFRGTPR